MLDEIRWAISDWWREYWSLFAVLVFAFAAILGFAAAGIYFVDRPSCYAAFRDANMPARWSFYGGCQIHVDGRWIPAEAYRVTKADD